MNLRKKAVKIAACALFAAALPVSANTLYENDETKLDMYGRLVVNFVHETENSETQYTGFQNNGSRLGLKGSHDIGDGLSTYGRFEARFDGSTRTADFNPRHTYFGLKGDFGDIRAGEFEGVFDDYVSGISDLGRSSVWDYYSRGDDHDEGRNLAYYNTIEEVSFGIMLTHQEKDKANDLSQAFNFQAGTSVPVHEMVKLNLAINQDEDEFGQGDPIFGAAAELAIIDGLDLALALETQNDYGTQAGISGKYSLDKASMYGYLGGAFLDDDVSDEIMASLGSDYKITGGLRAFVEFNYTEETDGDNDATAVAIGSRFDF